MSWKKIRTTANPNTKEYWDKNYHLGERGGSYTFPNEKDEYRLYSTYTYFHKEIEEVLASIPNPKLIDIGGGTGLGAHNIKGAYPELTCWNLDISQYAIDLGKEKYPDVHQVCHDLKNDVTSLGLNESFDLLICSDCLEHVDTEPPTTIKNILNFLKLGGHAIFAHDLNEQEAGAGEHVWGFTRNNITELLMEAHTEEVTFCKYYYNKKRTQLSACYKFKKMKLYKRII